MISIAPHLNYRAIVKSLSYHKWDRMWRFTFACSVFIENCFISNFIVLVNLVSIFADIIFNNLRLLLMIYQLPIHRMFYWENYITDKY